LIAANSVADHIHLLFPLPRTIPTADVVREIKANSSRWINETQALQHPFRWQSGYGVFSVSACQQARIVQYIANQREHHRTQTYQEEFRRLLEEYAIAYDERYVWD
jgi:REP element-mobilizing transposase RayT